MIADHTACPAESVAENPDFRLEERQAAEKVQSSYKATSHNIMTMRKEAEKSHHKKIRWAGVQESVQRVEATHDYGRTTRSSRLQGSLGVLEFPRGAAETHLRNPWSDAERRGRDKFSPKTSYVRHFKQRQ